MKLINLDDANQLVINDELYGLVSFKNLISNRRSAGRDEEYIINELLYLYFMYDLRSDFMIYSEEDRAFRVLEELSLEEGYKEDSIMEAAARLYTELTQTKVSTMVKSMYSIVDKTNEFIEDINLNDRDPVTGKFIFNIKDVVDAGNKLTVLAEKVAKLEEIQAQQIKEKTKIRGNRTKSVLEDL